MTNTNHADVFAVILGRVGKGRNTRWEADVAGAAGEITWRIAAASSATVDQARAATEQKIRDDGFEMTTDWAMTPVGNSHVMIRRT